MQIPNKKGLILRARGVNSSNITDIKEKFFPLSFHQIVLKNKKHLLPPDSFTIDEVDPFKWGREICLFQNEERNCLNKIYTKKLSKNKNQISFISELNSINYHMDLEKLEKSSISENKKNDKLKEINSHNFLLHENPSKKASLPKIIEMLRMNKIKREISKNCNMERIDNDDIFTHRVYEKKLGDLGKIGGYLVQRMKKLR